MTEVGSNRLTGQHRRGHASDRDTMASYPQAADVAVVLGAAVWKGGVPSPSLSRRALHGILLYKENVVHHIIFSGGIGKYPPTEARVMRNLAVAEGVPEAKMTLEEAATNTLQSAQACSLIIQKNQWSKVVIVTDNYHMLRSIIAFRRFGINVSGSAPMAARTQTKTLRWWCFRLREVFALAWYLIIMWRTAPHKSR